MTIRVLNVCLFASMALYFWALPLTRAQAPSSFTRAEQAEIDSRVRSQVQDNNIRLLVSEMEKLQGQLRTIDQEHREMRTELASVKWSAVGFGGALSALHLLGLILGRGHSRSS